MDVGGGTLNVPIVDGEVDGGYLDDEQLEKLDALQKSLANMVKARREADNGSGDGTQIFSTTANAANIEQSLCQMYKEESIGVDVNPRCGDCKCGNCSIGNKTMSLKNERLYEMFRNNMIYDEKGTPEDPGPYWRSKLPFIVDRHELSDNKKNVLAV